MTRNISNIDPYNNDPSIVMHFFFSNPALLYSTCIPKKKMYRERCNRVNGAKHGDRSCMFATSPNE